jgi:hypothetical protein
VLVGVGLRLGMSGPDGVLAHHKDRTDAGGGPTGVVHAGSNNPNLFPGPARGARSAPAQTVSIRTRADDGVLRLDREGLERLRAWERAQALRELGSGMPSVDRKGLEHYLRTRAQGETVPPISVQVADSRTLQLQSLHGCGLVHGVFIRTFLDATFHNPRRVRLEGTFEYPLPRGAVPVYCAVYAAGPRSAPPPRFDWSGPPPSELKLATLAPEALARQISRADWSLLLEARVPPGKTITPGKNRLDPADTTAFSAGPFPIEPAGYCRVLFAYVEQFAVADGMLQYRLPLPEGDCPKRFTVCYPLLDCVTPSVLPDTATREQEGAVCSHVWSSLPSGGEVRLRFASAIGGRFEAAPDR